jgi:hypothetical protein
MKKIKIEFREVVVTTKIILVPNRFKFEELLPGVNDWGYDGDEEGFRFDQVKKYFDKSYKGIKLTSNQFSCEFYVHSVEEIK